MNNQKLFEVKDMIVKTMPVGEIGTNCYLLGDESAKVCAVVDPGGDAPAIRKMIEDSGCALKLILLTHAHYDHTGGIEGLEEFYPHTPVYVHLGDVEGVSRGLFPPIDESVRRSYGEGDQVELGGLTIDVLHTPGHSKGSVTLKVGDVLFTGDTLFQGSMGRTDLRGGSYEEIMASLKRLGELPGDYHICPGHMGLSTLERERKTNYYMQEALQG